jgi:lysine 2,3-aminomutase
MAMKTAPAAKNIQKEPVEKRSNAVGHACPLPQLPAQVRQTILSPVPLEDPVGRQYIPDIRERNVKPEENYDPIGDHVHSPVKGIVHRHTDRALLKITDICTAYCRFCFRKEMVGKGQGVLKEEEIEKALFYIRNHPEIKEIILTGGDPLTLSNRRLEKLLKQIEDIPHIDIIRIHTRTPFMQPGRIDEDLIRIFQNINRAFYIVLHINHLQEINDAVKNALKRLSRSGAVLLSQTVLLKDINNCPDILEKLLRQLVALRVKPYYLHHPDLAPGTSHFRVTIEEGRQIIKELRRRLTGLAWPTYVLDIPGGYGKIPLGAEYATPFEEGRYLIEDLKGDKHVYPPKGFRS